MLNLNKLNPQQREAVTTTEGPVLILAGAGTGKTRVITCRIAWLAERGVPRGNILAVTFTNKAAREMQERVAELLPTRRRKQGGDAPEEERPTISTFHSLCVRILRQHIEKLGYKRNFVIYDETEQLSTVKRILSDFVSKSFTVEPGAVLAILSRVKNGGRNAEFFGDPMYRELARLVRPRYESALRACNAVDFDDLILLTLRLFEEHPEALEACRAKYRYIMVDEYQDTNAAQFKLVHALTEKHRNLCVVGDDDQSIYGWRGAEIANLLDMEKHFPEVKVVKLEQNYRSTNTILNAANAVIKRNAARRGKALWSQNGDGAKIEMYSFQNEEEEARSLVDRIQFARMARRVSWSQQAVLFRTNAQSRPIETALRRASVRYRLIGGQSFFDRKEVRDVLGYFKVLVNPHDDASLLRIANVPARGLSDVTMERLVAASAERKSSVYSAMRNPAVTAMFQRKTAESIEEFVRFIEHRRGQLQHPAAGNSLQVWAADLMESTGYYREMLRLEKNVETGENRVRNLKDLIGSLDARSEGKTLSARLENYLEEITLDAERETEEEAGDAVTLITMHSCKGLEFPHVHIVGMEQGLLPHARSEEEDSVDEERRLFYVALTRAMQTLALSYCKGRTKYGKIMPAHPSVFLKELPVELVERMDETSARPVSADAGKSLFDALRASLE